MRTGARVLIVLTMAATTLAACSAADERDLVLVKLKAAFPASVREDVVLAQNGGERAVLCGTIRPRSPSGSVEAARRFIIPTGSNPMVIEPAPGDPGAGSANQQFALDWRAYCGAA